MNQILKGLFSNRFKDDSFNNVKETKYNINEEQLIDLQESNILEEKLSDDKQILKQDLLTNKDDCKKDVMELLKEASRLNLDIKNKEVDRINSRYRKIMLVLNELLESIAYEKISGQKKLQLIEQDKENFDKNKTKLKGQDYIQLKKVLTYIIQQQDLNAFEEKLIDLQKLARISTNCKKKLKEKLERSSTVNGNFLRNKDRMKKSVSFKRYIKSKSPLSRTAKQNRTLIHKPASYKSFNLSPLKRSEILSRNLSTKSKKKEILNNEQKKILKQKKIIYQITINKIEKKLKVNKQMLQLNKSQFDDSSLNYIFLNYKKVFSFKKINLSYNYITDNGFAILFHYIIINQEDENFQIEQIQLIGNKMTKKVNMTLKKILKLYKGQTIEVRVDKNVIVPTTSQSKFSQVSEVSQLDFKRISKLKPEIKKKFKDQRKKIIKTTMSCQPMKELSEQAKNQLACNLAVLILHDEKSDITNESISRLVKESGNTVPDYWPMLLAKALEGQDVASFLQVTGGSGGSGPAQAQGGNQEAAQEEEKPETEEESEDMDMGGLFD